MSPFSYQICVDYGLGISRWIGNSITKTSLLGILILMPSLLLGADSAHPEDESPKAALYIGLTLPNSGPERDRGEAMRRGATLAAEETNRDGGIHGVPLKLRIEETDTTGKSQVKAFSNLSGDSEVPVIITGGEDEASVLKELAELNQVLLLNNSMRTDSVEGVSYSMRIGRSVRAAQDGVFALLRERRITRLAVLHGDEAWTAAALSQIASMSRKQQVEIVSNSKLWDLQGKLRSDVVGIVKKGNQEFVYLVSTDSFQMDALAALKKANSPSSIIGLFTCSSSASLDPIKDYSVQLYSVDVAVDTDKPEYTKMVEAFRGRFPKLEITFDTLVAYDAVKMVADAYRIGAGTSAAVRDYLLNEKKFLGAGGELSFTKGGDSERPVEINLVSDGKCKRLALGSAQP